MNPYALRVLISVGVVLYLAFQTGVLYLLHVEGRLGNLSILSHVRPLAILICYIYTLKEGGKWPFFLAIWAATGVLRSLLTLPMSALDTLDTAIHLLIAIPAFIAWKMDDFRDYYSPGLITRIRTWLLPEPRLEIIELGTPIDEVYRRYKIVKESGEPLLEGCNHHEFTLGDQTIMIDEDDGKVVGVTYDPATQEDTEAQRLRNLKFYLQAHGRESPLEFFVNNGFGFLYQSRDGRNRASYSYVFGIFSVSRSCYDKT